MPIPLEPQRLRLGRWQSDLLDAMVALHGDPKVHPYFYGTLSIEMPVMSEAYCWWSL